MPSVPRNVNRPYSADVVKTSRSNWPVQVSAVSTPVTVPLASMVTSPLADRTLKMPKPPVPTDTAPGAVWMPLHLTSPMPTPRSMMSAFGWPAMPEMTGPPYRWSG